MNQRLLRRAAVLLLGMTALSQAAPFQETEWKVPRRSARKKNPLPDDPATVAKGKLVFEAQCISCHGASGVGDGVAAKDLEKHPGDLTSAKVQANSDGALFWKITTGRAPMTAFGDTLSVEERWQVVRYVRGFAGGGLKVAAPEFQAPEPLRASLSAMQGAYDGLRASLAKGDAKAATGALPALSSALTDLQKIDVSKLDAKLAGSWKKTLEGTVKAMAALRGAEDLKGLRAGFGGLSVATEAAWTRFGHTGKSPLYVFECSKASQAGPARWVQATREPDNPYLGSKEDSNVKLLKGIAATRPKGNAKGEAR